jgi:hypothetical protein
LGCAVSVCLLALISFNISAETAENPAETALDVAVVQLEDGSTLAYPMDRSVPLIKWEHWPEELRVDVPAETFEVFADGTVRVTYPEFRRPAGVFERRLSSEEFHQLLTQIAISGLTNADGLEWKRAVAHREMQNVAGQTNPSGISAFDYRTSETITVVRTRFQILPPHATTAPTDGFASNVFRYRGLETDAARHPDHPELQVMIAVQRELLAIAHRMLQEAEVKP